MNLGLNETMNYWRRIDASDAYGLTSTCSALDFALRAFHASSCHVSCSCSSSSSSFCSPSCGAFASCRVCPSSSFSSSFSRTYGAFLTCASLSCGPGTTSTRSPGGNNIASRPRPTLHGQHMASSCVVLQTYLCRSASSIDAKISASSSASSFASAGWV